jgi:mannose-6-phosphate isomerase-like protein (cupin superfamily)
MSFPVYDFRREEDVRNLLVTPPIRARFARMQPGEEAASFHSHDLGHEVFLILQGRAVFNIDGEEAELGPGQMCVALADQSHKVRVVSDEPMIMYLSVTPHIQPTHTGRTPEGGRHPAHFSPSSSYDVETDSETPVAALIGRFAELAEATAAAARKSADRATRLEQAIAAGDGDATEAARIAVWEEVYATFRQVYEMGDVWNALAPRTTETR